MSYRFVAGDTASKLRVTCKDDDSKVAIDLTGCSVTLRWKDAAGSLHSRAMSIVAPATGGVAEYQFLAGELFAPAISFEVRVTDATGRVLHNLHPLNVNVRNPFAA